MNAVPLPGWSSLLLSSSPRAGALSSCCDLVSVNIPRHAKMAFIWNYSFHMILQAILHTRVETLHRPQSLITECQAVHSESGLIYDLTVLGTPCLLF